jgi:hypothetical protein
MFRTYTIVFLLVTFYKFGFACTGGSSNGTLTPTTTFQTQSILNGEYYSVSVNKCDTYTFTFCQGGGSAAWDTELTILDNTGVTTYAYSDDDCSTQSEVTWSASFTGTIRILISRYSCNHDLGSSGTLAYIYSAAPSNFCLGGDATTITVGSETCVQLTPEVNTKSGCAWNQSTVNFASNFNLSVDYYFGDNVNGADGTTFTFKPGSDVACGTNGGQMGAGGLANSLVVEFDTYDNDSPAHIIDIAADHIAVETDGDMLNAAPFAGPVAAKSDLSNIDNGVTHEVEIDWNASTQDLKIYFDSDLRLTVNHDFVTNVFGGTSDVYWGVTGATGGLNNQQYFCPNTLVILPVEMTSFSFECKNQIGSIEWETSTEIDISHFELEETTDGILFKTIATIQPSGGTSTLTQYRFPIHVDETQKYYRLRAFDINGSYQSTKLISSYNCFKQKSDILNSMHFTNNYLNLTFNEPFIAVDLYDLAGNLIYSSHSFKEKFIYIKLPSIEAGIYIMKLKNKQNEIEVHKFLSGN